MGHELWRLPAAERRGKQLRPLRRRALSDPRPRQGFRTVTLDPSGKGDSVQQGVAGYDPQVRAMPSLSLATIVYRMARGSSPEP